MTIQQLLRMAAVLWLLGLATAFNAQGQEEKTETGTGTAFVVGPQGHLLTCYNLIAKASRVEVSMSGKKYEATIVASDPQRDLALLSINATGLTPLPLGDSSQIAIGQEVQACGFPISSLPGSSPKVAKSSISGISPREAVQAILFDASTIPGVFGGPLMNERGEVVGVLSAKLAGEMVSSVGFAIPINYAITLLRDKGVTINAQAAKEKLSAPDLEKQAASSVVLMLVTPEGANLTPGEKRKDEKQTGGGKKPTGPPNCLWVSPAEMAAAAAALEAKQRSLQTLDAAALKSLASEVLGSIYLFEGLDLHEQKLDEEAVEYLKKAAALSPGSALTHAMLAMAAGAAGNQELGDREMEQARKIDPQASATRRPPASPMWVLRSEMESLRERLSHLVGEGAQPDAQALQAVLKRAAALFALWKGDYRWLRGVLPLAETEYARALSLDPECAEALTASAYIADKRNDLATAQELLRKAYATDAKSERVIRAIQEFVVVYHKDFLPPRIEILSPKPGEQIFAVKGNHLLFTAVDDIGRVEDIEVFLNKTSIAKRFGAGKYDVEWNARGLQYTKATLRITAVDGAGNAAEAKVIVDIIPK